MKLYLCYIISFLICLSGYSQNLVTNGNFESYANCPNSISQLTQATGWLNANNCASDYFNTCANPCSGVKIPVNSFGIENANSGNGYVGIFFYKGKDYIQTQLTDTLQQGQRYCIELYVSLAEASMFIASPLQVLFSSNAASANQCAPINAIPQISFFHSISSKNNWHLLKASFVAQGGEQFLTIGSFLEDSLMQITPSDSISWFICNQNNNPNIPIYSYSFDLCYFFIDDVSVYACELEEPKDTSVINDSSFISFPNVFSPNNDGINDVFLATHNNVQQLNCNIYNRWGELLYVIAAPNMVWDGTTFSGKKCAEGVYFYTYTATLNNGNIISDKGNIQLVK